MSGFTGRIVRINLTNQTVSYIETSPYASWGGGHGLGAALFYDIAVVEKGLDLENMDHSSPDDGGFHPESVLVITTSPLTASGVPAATGRSEIAGIGVQSFPIGWFTRGQFGGRFGSMLKFAGYDGIVIEGTSRAAVWIDIRDDRVDILPCDPLNLWGKDTIETQEAIWSHIIGENDHQWYTPEGVNLETMQKPAVLTIGPAGENRSRMACLIHDCAYAAGQGGFGGIWGAKNLKAISVLGSGSVPISKPAELLALRVAQKEFQFDPDNIEMMDLPKICSRHYNPPMPIELYGLAGPGEEPPSVDFLPLPRAEEKRPQSCMGCFAGCRARYKSGKANEASCAGTLFYMAGNTRQIRIEAVDLLNRFGFNAFDMIEGLAYLKILNEEGILGRDGAEIETILDYNDYGSLEFIKTFLDDVAYRRTPFGDTVAEGFRRAMAIWKRDDDLGGKIRLPYWGLPEHGYDCRAELEWGYGSLLGDRDINEHCFNSIFHYCHMHDMVPYVKDAVSARDTVAIFTEKMVPHTWDYSTKDECMQMLNYATENMYSPHIARLVSWHRHYTRYYKRSMIFCDFKWPDFVNITQQDLRGSTIEVEPKFIEAVTGKHISFVDGMRIGRKIWNLDNAIWTLQGRHRDMVRFPDYLYDEDYTEVFKWPTYTPNADIPEEQWAYRNVGGRRLDREGFEKFKTEYYKIEEWDSATGWPTRELLEKLDLAHVADTLAGKGKLA